MTEDEAYKVHIQYTSGVQTFSRSIYYSHDRKRTTFSRFISNPHNRKRTTFEVVPYLLLLLYAVPGKYDNDISSSNAG